MRYAAHRIAALAVAGFLALTASTRAQEVDPGSAEYLIKAGFVYNFAKLVEWPNSAAQKDQPIVIAVLGNDEFAAILKRVVQGKKLDNRQFVVKLLKERDFKDCGCQMLFVARAESVRLEDIIHFQKTSSVLTISESPDFARRGGIIAFVLEDSKVHFEVNVEAAKQATLTISSRLLSLATIVQVR